MAVAASAEPQLVGIAVAMVLAAIFLAGVLGRRRRRPAAVVEGNLVPVADRAVAGDEAPAGDAGTDVIIVGAGVAGSALAYTLGKVLLLSHLSLVGRLPVVR
jgi:squalene monooxygenase